MTTKDELAARRLAMEERLPSFPWYSVTDLARRWHVSPQTVRNIPVADLPYKAFGNGTLKRRRYRADWVQSYEEQTERAA
jgi:hypothetical protein